MTRPLILVSQRVDDWPERGERRDALDQRWAAFLETCGLLAIPVPNATSQLDDYLQLANLGGILLTGGNDIAGLGEDVPERDAIEARLIAHALQHRRPLLGVCRGMQSIQHAWGLRLQPVEGHVTAQQLIQVGPEHVAVNSYHRFGTRETVAELDCWARATDGVVKAIRHRTAPLLGIMWHPERSEPFIARDIALFQEHFQTP